MKPRRQQLCPICAQPQQRATAPFCSPRCKDEDLRRWLVGAYRIPGDPAAEPDDAAPGRAEERA
jgi:endogenous inhibitor of DNA gyrase (YacG/DUF329 family)